MRIEEFIRVKDPRLTLSVPGSSGSMLSGFGVSGGASGFRSFVFVLKGMRDLWWRFETQKLGSRA